MSEFSVAFVIYSEESSEVKKLIINPNSVNLDPNLRMSCKASESDNIVIQTKYLILRR